MKRVKLSWEKYRECIKEINTKIDFYEIDLIVGLTRGGLVPAVHLSNLNNVKMMTLALSFRDNADMDMYEKELSEVKKYKNILIVDDIYDSGKTIKKLKEDLSDNNIKFYTIFSTDENKVDYFNIKKENNDWIEFPWENF